jgi:hypothetical protein
MRWPPSAEVSRRLTSPPIFMVGRLAMSSRDMRDVIKSISSSSARTDAAALLGFRLEA